MNVAATITETMITKIAKAMAVVATAATTTVQTSILITEIITNAEITTVRAIIPATDGMNDRNEMIAAATATEMKTAGITEAATSTAARGATTEVGMNLQVSEVMEISEVPVTVQATSRSSDLAPSLVKTTVIDGTINLIAIPAPRAIVIRAVRPAVIEPSMRNGAKEEVIAR